MEVTVTYLEEGHLIASYWVPREFEHLPVETQDALLEQLAWVRVKHTIQDGKIVDSVVVTTGKAAR